LRRSAAIVVLALVAAIAVWRLGPLSGGTAPDEDESGRVEEGTPLAAPAPVTLESAPA
jgi:hypothetical protein